MLLERIDGYCAMAVDRLTGQVYDGGYEQLGEVAATLGACLARMHLAVAKADVGVLTEALALLPPAPAFDGLGAARARRLAGATALHARLVHRIDDLAGALARP